MASVDLTWNDNSNNEDGFRIYRSTDSNPLFSGDYTQIDSVGANTTSYTDTNAPDGQTVYYAVTAYNSAGESGETTDSVETWQEETRVATAHVNTVQAAATRAGEGARAATAWTATVTAAATRAGAGLRAPSSYASTIQARAQRVGEGARAPVTHVGAVWSGATYTKVVLRGVTGWVPTVQAAATRAGEGERAVASYVTPLQAAATRAGEGNRVPGSFLSTVPTDATRAGEGDRSVASYVTTIQAAATRAGTGSRASTSYVAAVHGDITLGVTVTPATHVAPIYGAASTTAQMVISGEVTLQGNPVEGAYLYGVNDDTGEVEDTATTAADGTYELVFPPETVAHVAVQYEDGEGQEYNDFSKPFLEG